MSDDSGICCEWSGLPECDRSCGVNEAMLGRIAAKYRRLRDAYDELDESHTEACGVGMRLEGEVAMLREALREIASASDADPDVMAYVREVAYRVMPELAPCTCDPEAFEVGPEGQRRYFEDRYCPIHGEGSAKESPRTNPGAVPHPRRQETV